MANRRADPVSYRPFRADPLLADGLLAVARDDGSLERKVAQGLANMAAEAGQRADREAAIAGGRQGALDAMNAAPGAATVSGGEVTSEGGDGVRVRVAPAQIRTILSDAAVRHGEDPELLTEIAGIESSFNPLAQNPNSSAGGLLQFTDGTARQYQLGNKLDAGQSADAGARLLRDNRAGLRKALGREPTGGELYLAHQQGVGGAIKLLTNPNANAAELVGAKAVANNGGSIGMTAGQFAGLWTSKIKSGGGSYTRLPAAAADAPVSVTPVRSPVEVSRGAPGGFRPRGGNTIYDQAYDVKGTNTYLQQLDLVMLQDQAAVYEAYKDDPVKLEKAMGELLQAHMQDHVFPDIAPEYSNAFQKQAFVKVQRAKAAFEERKVAQDKLDYLGRVDTLEDQKSQALAGLDVNDPNAPALLANLQGSIDSHYDAGVARGVLTPAEAEGYKRKSRSEAVTGFYVGQTQKMKADDIRTMRAEMTKDYAAGELDGVTADDWERIDKGLAAAESARRTQDDKADADLAKRGEDIAKRVARGLPVDAATMSRFQMDAGTAPKGKEIVASTLTRLKLAEAIRTQPIGAVEKALPSILGEGASAEDYDFARKAVADQRKELQTDPIGVAERFGVLPVSPSLPLDGDVDSDAVSGAFSERINQAQAAAKHFGVTPRYFRPGEAEQIQAAVISDPEKGLAIAAGLVDAAGGNADRMLAELGAAAPAVSLSGGLVASGGDPKAARDLIAGFGKSPDGKDYADMPNTKRIPLATVETGGALAFTPGEMNRLDAAAAAIARKRLYDAGIDPKKDDAKEVYQRAFQEAAGASFVNNVQFGGFGNYDRGAFYRAVKVVVPPAIRADRFADVVGSLTDADIGAVKAKNGKTWTAADYQKAVPVAVKGGYVFALGDPSGSSPMFIADAAARPVVLDIAGMRDRLQPREPEAWR